MGDGATMLHRLNTLARSAVEHAPVPVMDAVKPVNRSLPGHRVRWGNVRRLKPFSDRYGWDRGLPVDRWYIESFMVRQSARITGHVLEIKTDLYASRFGSPAHVTVADRDAANTHATLVTDLDVPGSLPSSAFDAILLNQALQYLEPVTAVPNLAQTLRPGGALIVTVPALARIDDLDGGSDKWRWTELGLRSALERGGDLDVVTTRAHGNHLTCLAAILGLAAKELTRAEIETQDPRFPLIVRAVAVRSGVGTAP